MGGVDLEEVGHRCDLICHAVEDEVGVGISAGLAMLAAGETLDEITARADAGLIDARMDRRR